MINEGISGKEKCECVCDIERLAFSWFLNREDCFVCIMDYHVRNIAVI